jgi:DNA-binding NarL/FixJ family response regulator
MTSNLGALGDLTRALHPQVVVIGCDPVARSIGLDRDPSVPTVVISGFWSDTDLVALLRAGINGLTSRAASTEEIVSVIAGAADGVLCFPRGWEATLVAWLQSEPAPLARLGHDMLTGREEEVVRLVVAGCSTKHIAGELGIAPQTAKNHLCNIMRKVGVRSRVQLCSWGIEHGLLGRPSVRAS